MYLRGNSMFLRGDISLRHKIVTTYNPFFHYSWTWLPRICTLLGSWAQRLGSLAHLVGGTGKAGLDSVHSCRLLNLNLCHKHGISQRVWMALTLLILLNCLGNNNWEDPFTIMVLIDNYSDSCFYSFADDICPQWAIFIMGWASTVSDGGK